MSAKKLHIDANYSLQNMKEYVENPLFFNGGTFKPIKTVLRTAAPIIHKAPKEDPAPWVLDEAIIDIIRRI